MKCNVANGWCNNYDATYRSGCTKYNLTNEVRIKECPDRLRMNRLEKAQNKSILISTNLDIQWEKEKEKVNEI